MADDKSLVVKPADPAALALFQAEKETGFEETTSADYAVPFLLLLQDLSPQIKPSNAKYIAEAKVGQFLDQATGELFDSLSVIPILYKRAMVEWKPRVNGGGFVATHEVGFEIGLPRDEHGNYITKDKNEVKDTRYFYCLRLTKDGDYSPVVLALTSTQIVKAKNWLSKMDSLKMLAQDGVTKFTPPMFANSYKMTSVLQTKGAQSWYGYVFSIEGPVSADVFNMAKDWRETFKTVSVSIKPPSEPEAEPGTESKM